jgi:surfactin family lipopeptide synthetase A
LVATLSPSGRKRTELQELLGYFLNPVALRFDLSSNPTFAELVEMASKVVSEAISNDDVPLELLAEKLNLRSDPHGFSLPGAAISLQPAIPATIRSEWDVTSMDAGNGGTMWDLYVAFIDRPDGIIGRVQYNSDMFPKKTILRILRDLEFVFDTLVAAPNSRLSDLAITMEEE